MKAIQRNALSAFAAPVVALALVAAPSFADAETAAEFVAAVEANCDRQGLPKAPCMAEKRMRAAAGLDQMNLFMPRLVAMCEAEHDDPLAVVWCGTNAVRAMKAARP